MPSTATATTGQAFGPDGPEMSSAPDEKPMEGGWYKAGYREGVARGERKMEAFIEADGQAQIAGVVRALGAAGITIALMVVILNQVFEMDMVNETDGPFDVDVIEGPLSGALGLLGLGIFVGGARVVMRQLGGGGNGGGGL